MNRPKTTPTGPSVSYEDIAAEIVAEYSTTLDECFRDAPLMPGMNRVSLHVLVLRNGTKLVGVNYGAISPENHDPATGRSAARSAAFDQAWPLLGFRLRDQLARPTLTEADAAADLAGTPRPDHPSTQHTE